MLFEDEAFEELAPVLNVATPERFSPRIVVWKVPLFEKKVPLLKGLPFLPPSAKADGAAVNETAIRMAEIPAKVFPRRFGEKLGALIKAYFVRIYCVFLSGVNAKFILGKPRAGDGGFPL